MRAPIATKLAELRQAIERIEATPRKGFTPAQRKAVFEAYDGHCAGCDEPLKKGWEVDHIKELRDGGAHELSNWQALCGRDQNGCHQGKTSAFARSRAKSARIVKRETEGAPVSRLKSRNEWPKARKLQSRGFRRFIPTRTA
jgi:5-methylcytosine-specific restriction endonuclease McrA